MLIVNKSWVYDEVLAVFTRVTPNKHKGRVATWVEHEWLKRYLPTGEVYVKAVEDVLCRLDQDGFRVQSFFTGSSYAPKYRYSWEELQEKFLDLAWMAANFPYLTGGQLHQANQSCTALSYSSIAIDQDDLTSVRAVGVPCVSVSTWPGAKSVEPLTWVEAEQRHRGGSHGLQLNLRNAAALIVQVLISITDEEQPSYKRVLEEVRRQTVERKHDELVDDDSVADAQLVLDKNACLSVEGQRVHVVALLRLEARKLVAAGAEGFTYQDNREELKNLEAALHAYVTAGLTRKTLPEADTVRSITVRITLNNIESVGHAFNPYVDPRVLSEVWTGLEAYVVSCTKELIQKVADRHFRSYSR